MSCSHSVYGCCEISYSQFTDLQRGTLCGIGCNFTSLLIGGPVCDVKGSLTISVINWSMDESQWWGYTMYHNFRISSINPIRDEPVLGKLLPSKTLKLFMSHTKIHLYFLFITRALATRHICQTGHNFPLSRSLGVNISLYSLLMG